MQCSIIAWFIILPVSKLPTSPALGITQNGGSLFHLPVIPHSNVSNGVPDFPSNGSHVTLQDGKEAVDAGLHSKMPGCIRVIPQSTYAEKRKVKSVKLVKKIKVLHFLNQWKEKNYIHITR